MAEIIDLTTLSDNTVRKFDIKLNRESHLLIVSGNIHFFLLPQTESSDGGVIILEQVYH